MRRIMGLVVWHRAPRTSAGVLPGCVLMPLLAVGATPTLGGAQADSSTPGVRADALFTEWDRTDSPGLAVGVIRDGIFVYRSAFGMANLEHGVPWTASTVARVGSLAKQFTAMAVLLLVENGDLALETDVRLLVADLVPYDVAITVADLLHHTSGIRDYGGLAQLRGHRRVDYMSREDVAELLARQHAYQARPAVIIRDSSSEIDGEYWPYLPSAAHVDPPTHRRFPRWGLW